LEELITQYIKKCDHIMRVVLKSETNVLRSDEGEYVEGRVEEHPKLFPVNV